LNLADANVEFAGFFEVRALEKLVKKSKISRIFMLFF